MTILVTGGAGFIGSHTVVELVKAGFNPIIIDNLVNSNLNAIEGINSLCGKSVPFYQVDCNDILSLRKVFEDNKIEGIIHFAAFKAVGESVENPLKYYRNNILSLLNILDLMQEFGIRNLVFSSSCTVYGEPELIPVTENTDRKKAESPYGNTKSICEDILSDVSVSNKNINLISLRYFNPIGAHESSLIGELPNGVPSNLVPFITQTAIGKREKLTVFGDDYDTPDGSNIRDFIHVVDLAKAHVAALKSFESSNQGFYEVFNIGTGKGNSVLEIVKTFEHVNNLKLNYEIGPRRSGDVEKIFGDVEKAKKILNWQAEKTLEDSLRDAWNWEVTLKNKKNEL
jgi:UDP-glucose 4-epimerase